MPLNGAQKQQVTQFQGVTGSDKKLAEKQLRGSNWDIQTAVDAYFAANPRHAVHATSSSSTASAALNKVFDKYRDSATTSCDTLLISGTQRYLSDLSIPLDSPALLTLSTLVNATTLGTIPRAGFIAAWTYHKAFTIQQQAHVISSLTSNMSTTTCSMALPPSLLASLPRGLSSAGSEILFRHIYKHTFALALPPDNTNARAIPLDEACEYWRLLLGPSSPCLAWVGDEHKTQWLDLWTAYLQERWGKAVNRDLWRQTLLFAEKSKEDEGLEFWSEEAAWPGVVDGFVASVKDRRKREGWVGQVDGNGDEEMEP